MAVLWLWLWLWAVGCVVCCVLSVDALYTAIVSAYVEALLLGGQSLAFFVEGARSQSGKMLHPKTAMLKYALMLLLLLHPAPAPCPCAVCCALSHPFFVAAFWCLVFGSKVL